METSGNATAAGVSLFLGHRLLRLPVHPPSIATGNTTKDIAAVSVPHC